MTEKKKAIGGKGIMAIGLIAIIIVATVGVWWFTQQSGPTSAGGELSLVVSVSPNEAGTTNLGVGTRNCTKGENLTVTFTPMQDYLFNYWELDGTNMGNVTTLKITMNTNRFLKVYTTKIFKMAMLVEGALQDGSYNEYMYRSLKSIEAAQQDIRVSYSEYVPVSDFARVASGYGDRQYDMVLGHTYAYQDAAISIAPNYNKTWFVVTGGFKLGPPNVAALGIWGNEAYYLTGILAAKMTKTGTVAVLASFQVASQLEKANGFITGARSVNPNITILRNFSGDFSDVPKNMEAAITLIEGGADWICCVGSGQAYGAVQAVKETTVLMTGCMLDMNNLSPDHIVTSVQYMPILAPLLSVIDSARRGELQPKSHDFFMTNGGSGLAPYHGFNSTIPQATKDAVEAARQKILLGTLKVPFIPNSLLP